MIDARKLHDEFVRLGSMKLKLKNRMLAILPAIYESGIWKKFAGSITEYAGKYGDIAKTTVIKRLRLEENLKDKPNLKAAIAKVGVHKVAMVAKIATVETEKIFAEHLSNMSKSAVQSLAKELRAGRQNGHAQQKYSGQQLLLNKQLSFEGRDLPAGQQSAPKCQAVAITKKIELDEESTFFFLKLKAKLGKNLSDQAFLKIILAERVLQEFPKEFSEGFSQETSEESFEDFAEGFFGQEERDTKSKITNMQILVNAQTKTKITIPKSVTGDTFATSQALSISNLPTSAHDNTFATSNSSPANNETDNEKAANTTLLSAESRYIPAIKKRQTIAQTKGKCAYPNCNSPYAVIHHADRYSESKNHDSIIPLCKIHHEFAHNNLIKNEQSKTDEWQISITKPPATKKADILYRKYRQRASSLC